MRSLFARLSGNAARVATVRVVGGALTLLSLFVGLHYLGAREFGRSVILLSAGMLLALPSTSAERLVLRLAAGGDLLSANHLVRRFSGLAGITVLVGAIISAVMLSLDFTTWHAPLVVATVAASTSEVALRQARARATGALMWGQVPNDC